MAIDNTNALLTFNVGPFCLGVTAVEVDAIINMPAFRSVPLTPPSVAGVFTYRDQIACIISLRRKFGLPDHADPTDGQLILAHLEAGLTAFWVDEVLDMETLSEINHRPLSSLCAHNAFDRFAFKKDQIFLHTNFQSLYDLNDTDVKAAVITTDTESFSAVTQTESDQVPPPAEHPVSKDTEFERCDLPESGAETSAQPSGAAAPTSVPVASQPTRNSTSAGTGIVGTAPAQQVRSRVPPRQHRSSASRQGPRRRPQHLSPLPAAPFANRNHRPAPSSKSYIMLVLLILLTLVIGGMLAYFLWPAKAPMVSPTVLTAKPLVAVTAPPDALVDVTVTTSIQASIPPQEATGGESTDAPVPTSEPEPLAAAVAEPAGIALRTPEEPDRPDPTPENQAIWRVETDDFIMTVERPQPEKSAPTLSSAPPLATGLHEMVHVVAPGDTLWHIAQRYLGDPFRYPELAALSRIKNPDLIYPGNIVRIQIKKQPPRQGAKGDNAS